MGELTATGAAVIDAQTGRWMLRPAAQDLLLEAVDLHGAHDFRHTYATWLEDTGVPARSGAWLRLTRDLLASAHRVGRCRGV